MTNVKFENNKALHGNLYIDVDVYTKPSVKGYKAINVTILLSNMVFIQASDARQAISIRVNVDLGYDNKGRYRNFGALDCDKKSQDYYFLLNNAFPQAFFDNYLLSLNSRRLSIRLQDIYVVGGCISVKDSNVVKEGDDFVFEMTNVTIHESQCFHALEIANDHTDNTIQLTLSDLTISSSYHNILYIDISGDKLKFIKNTTFVSNQGSVSVIGGEVIIKDFTNVSGNVARNYDSVFHIGESSSVSFQGEINFINNIGRQGGAISAYGETLYRIGTTVNFDGNATFIGNSAYNGGAISLKEGALVSLEAHTHMVFEENTAQEYGGAIYVEDEGLRDGKNIKCFIIPSGICKVEFDNNVAGVAGPALYGGMIDTCKISSHVNPPKDILVFNSENSVSSKAYAVHLCTNSTINKWVTETSIEAFPGQTVEIEVVTAGQRYGLSPASVRAETESDYEIIEQLQKVQDTQNACTKLNYTIKSSKGNETILLSVEQQSENILRHRNGTLLLPAKSHKLKLLISFLECPLGFVIDYKQNVCLCHNSLLQRGAQCNFDLYKVNRNAQQWIGVLIPANTIVVHQYCHLDYCNSFVLSLNLSSPDDQCNYNRSGILCGACQPGLSQVLGTSKCKKCSNLWLFLTIVFALAGAVLVAALTLLNLTVTTGTINGLIFYANIVRANNAAFFPEGMSNSFLSWFIAWLNLDLGVETCFYDRLDAYAKTWLQFVFPLYIWMLVALIILSSRYSKTVARICSRNAVQVLATLFILSYAKLLRVTIIIFQPTHLVDGHNVWYYDGNLDYLGRKHTPLMVAGLTFFVLFIIPYTVVLFGIQWLQHFSHYKVLCWVNKFKPLFDAYTGPYKDNHRYWTGLLLLVRILLFTVFSTNVTGDPSTNLLAIIIVTICLFAYLALFAGVYRTWPVNVLEYSFLLNLAILSTVVFYTRSLGGPVHTVTQISVGIAISIAAITVAYQSISAILKLSRLGTKIDNIYIHIRKKGLIMRGSAHTATENAATVGQKKKVTYSIVELQEPLMVYD